MKILQLSDIHYGGEYGGKFDCRRNFLSTLDYALNYSNDRIDLIVITGDLADTDHFKNYCEIKEVLDRYPNIPHIVLPGNHDSYNDMRAVFGDATVPTSGSMVKSGILFWNNCDHCGSEPPDGTYRTVFCHYPIGTVKHAFMEKHAHPHADTLVIRMYTEHGARDVFCGHFHCWSENIPSEAMRVHVCAATQCQLDRNEPECVPLSLDAKGGIGLPGYMVIDVDANTGITKDYAFHRVHPDHVLHAMGEYDFDAVSSNIESLYRLTNSMLEIYGGSTALPTAGIDSIRFACASIKRRLPDMISTLKRFNLPRMQDYDQKD